MITKRVVLILGAGASRPYGFPLAGEMIQQAVIGEQGLVPRLTELGFSKPQVESFLQELLRSQLPSIDAFLERRPEFLEVGKATLAFYLVAHEAENSLLNLRNPEHWYRYLYGLMEAVKVEDFRENALSIVTFNYDRSFEHYFVTALMASHKISVQFAQSLVYGLSIVHVYGQLGELPGRDGEHRPYSPDLNPEALREAMGGIRIVSEGTDHRTRFARAHDVIGRAEEIIFLGFGFHRENVSRLELPVHLPSSAKVTGTVKGFTNSEFELTIAPQFADLPGDALTNNRQTVYDFLRDNLHLLGVKY